MGWSRLRGHEPIPWSHPAAAPLGAELPQGAQAPPRHVFPQFRRDEHFGFARSPASGVCGPASGLRHSRYWFASAHSWRRGGQAVPPPSQASAPAQREEQRQFSAELRNLPVRAGAARERCPLGSLTVLDVKRQRHEMLSAHPPPQYLKQTTAHTFRPPGTLGRLHPRYRRASTNSWNAGEDCRRLG